MSFFQTYKVCKVSDEVKNISKTELFYTIFIAALPIVSVYASGIPGLTAGDLLLFVFFMARLVNAVKTNSLKISGRSLPILLLIIGIPLITAISLLGQQNIDTYDIFIRVVRRVFYYLAVVVVSNEWFNGELGEQSIVFLGKVGSIYMFIQYIAYYGASIILHGFLPFLKVYHEAYMLHDYEQIYLRMFRPTSFLLEPAHISRFLIIPLAILLFNSKFKYRWIWAFVISAAILASTSGIGIISVALVWFIWIVVGLTAQEGKKLPIYYLFIYILVVGAVIIALNTDVVQAAIFRITSSDLMDRNTAGGARFRGYFQYLQLDFWESLFGMGYGSTPDQDLNVWFTGAAYMLYGTGLVGFSVCIIMFAWLFFKSKSLVSKVLCIVFSFLFFTDDSFMSHVAVLYLSFICMFSDNANEEANYENTVLDG